jgi:hypothetical protein
MIPSSSMPRTCYHYCTSELHRTSDSSDLVKGDASYVGIDRAKTLVSMYNLIVAATLWRQTTSLLGMVFLCDVKSVSTGVPVRVEKKGSRKISYVLMTGWIFTVTVDCTVDPIICST